MALLPTMLCASLPAFLAAPPAQAATQYVLSGSVDGSATFHVDDDLDVYVNGALVYSDNTLPATPSARSPINFIADAGDTLRLVVRDTYGECASLTRLFLTDAVGRRTLVDPGFDLGCGRPTGNQGIVHDLTLPIPNLVPVPAFDEVLLPGSAFAGVVPGPNGLLYGATYDGGASNKGTIYAFDPWLSSVTLVHSFDGAGDGSTPYGELTFDPASGKFYGTTHTDGPSGVGTVFAFDPGTNALTTLASSFAGYDAPRAPLVSAGGFLYGVLSYTNGAVFRVALDGSGFTIIHPFADFGSLPQPLTLGADGLLYGVTIYGGVLCNPANPLYGCGTVFRLKPVLPGDTDAQFQTLHQFQYYRGDPCPDPPAPYCVEFPVNGANHPQGRPVFGSDGLLYGTTFYSLFSLDPASPGTSFKFVTTDGGGVSLAAIEGADTRLYVADYGGGPAGAGSVFSLNRDGSAPSGLHDFSFVAGLESYGPYGRPYRDAVGTVYGTTEYTVDSPYRGVVYAVSGAVAPPVLTGAASRKLHGAAGTFDLALSLTPANPTTAPRSGGAGGNHSIVFTFDKTVTGGAAAVTAGIGTAGGPSFSGSEMIVPLVGVADAQYVTVTVTDVVAADGGTGGGGSVRIGFLAGDVGQNRAVTLSDVLSVNAALTQPVTAANYLRDVNVNGALTLADLLLVNANLTQALPLP